MPISIEVLYDDGRISYFPETAFASAFGESVLDDISIRFDADIETDGLIVELRHHSPMLPEEDDFDYQSDPRGYPCQPHADAWPVLISPDEATDVIAIYYNGTLIFKRIQGALINLFHINQLAAMYFNEEETMATYVKIASIYHVLEEQRRRQLSDSIETTGDAESEHEAISKMMGLPPSVVRDALDFELYAQNMVDDETGEVLEDDDEDVD